MCMHILVSALSEQYIRRVVVCISQGRGDVVRTDNVELQFQGNLDLRTIKLTKTYLLSADIELSQSLISGMDYSNLEPTHKLLNSVHSTYHPKS